MKTSLPILIAASLLAPAAAGAEPQEPARDFKRYCSDCHGAEADGHGVDAATTPLPAADLTRIATRNGGVFPQERTVAIIRGDAEVAAHAKAGMVGWAEVFRFDGGLSKSPYPVDQALDRRIEALADYLAALQRN